MSISSLRQIRRRIRSVENTKKITRAMEMAAAAKLRRFQDFLESARPYTEKLGTLLDELLAELPPDYRHPYLGESLDNPLTPTLSPATGRGKGERLLVLFTSDTGLCGTYNGEVEGAAKDWIEKNPDRKALLIFVGKHGAGSFHHKGNEVLAAFSDLRVSRVDEILEGLRRNLETVFREGRVDEIQLIYTRMEGPARFHPVVERILPIERKNRTVPYSAETIIEPDAQTVLDKLIPAFFEARLRFAFYHALLTEQIARMNAMRQATQNAEEMIDELTLLRNKARQAAITKEIIEIVSGSQALKLK